MAYAGVTSNSQEVSGIDVYNDDPTFGDAINVFEAVTVHPWGIFRLAESHFSLPAERTLE